MEGKLIRNKMSHISRDEQETQGEECCVQALTSLNACCFSTTVKLKNH